MIIRFNCELNSLIKIVTCALVMFVIVHMSMKSRRHLTGSLWENKRAWCYFWLPSSHSVIQNVDKRDLDDKGCWYGSIRELQTMLCTIPMMWFHYPHAQSSNIKVHFQPIGYNITRCKFPSLHIGLIGVAIIQCYLFACTLERGMISFLVQGVHGCVYSVTITLGWLV